MVHQLLYCETEEADLYHHLFIRSAERAKIDFNEIDKEIVERIEKEYERRINQKAAAKESFGKDLIFYQILRLCHDEKNEEEILSAIDQPAACVSENIDMLVRINLLIKDGFCYKTTPKGKKLFRRLDIL
jgi:hypothetical protein